MKVGISRRVVLGALPAVVAQAFTTTPKKPKTLPRVGEFVRLLDPATEAMLVRLTALSSDAELPRPSNRFISVKSKFVIFSSNRGGNFAPYRLDLHSGTLEKLSDTLKLDVRSLALDRSERFLLFLDDGKVKEVDLSGRHERVVAQGVRQFALGASSADIVVLRGDSLEQIDGRKLAAEVDNLLSLDSSATRCLFTRQRGNAQMQLWSVDRDTGVPALLAEGDILFPFWSFDGSSLLFLRREGPGTRIVQLDIQTRTTQTLSGISPMACFAPNGDGSVFAVGLQSKAQPFVMLMLRSPRSEIALCEHHASDAAAVTPVFSPDSRRVYFQTNREGKNAIYSIDVSTLVEPTSAEGG